MRDLPKGAGRPVLALPPPQDPQRREAALVPVLRPQVHPEVQHGAAHEGAREEDAAAEADGGAGAGGRAAVGAAPDDARRRTRRSRPLQSINSLKSILHFHALQPCTYSPQGIS